MGYELSITFVVDSRQGLPPGIGDRRALWASVRPHLESWLRGLPGATRRDEAIELRADGRSGGMPSVELRLGDEDIYVCDYGDHARAREVVGGIVLQLVERGFVVTTQTLE